MSPALLVGLMALAPPELPQTLVLARSEGNVEAAVLMQVEQAARAQAQEVLGEQVMAPTEPQAEELAATRKKAMELMAAANDAANNLETDKALELAQQALQQWQGVAVTASDVRQLTEAHVLLFKACLWNERPQEAQEHVRAAVALQPSMVKLEGDSSEDEAALWKKVAGDVQRQSKGILSLVSNPPGARVFVDGVERGTTPVTVREMVPGSHVVRFVMPWRQPVLLTATVPGGGEGRAQASLLENDALARARTSLAQDPLTVPAQSWKNDLKALGAQHVLVLAVHKTGTDSPTLDITAHVFKLADGTRRRRVQAKVDVIKADKEVRDLVTNALAISKGAGTNGGARIEGGTAAAARPAVASPAGTEGGGEVAGAGAEEGSAGGGAPKVLLVVPWVVMAAVIPVVFGVALGGGFGIGALVTGLYYQDQMARQAEENRQAVRRGRAARDVTLGF